MSTTVPGGTRGQGGMVNAGASAREESLGELFSMRPEASAGGDLPPESDDGPVEYKRHLVSPAPARLAHLVTQLNFRLEEGAGEALYELGVEDGGAQNGITDAEMEASIATLAVMAERCGAEITVLRRKRANGDVDGDRGHATDAPSSSSSPSSSSPSPSTSGAAPSSEAAAVCGAGSASVAEVLVRRVPSDEVSFIEVRVASLGNVDAGKSTLLGVLTRGVLDNGRGRARAAVFRHAHELESGRTSSISHEIMGFRGSEVVNYKGVRAPTWTDICATSSKVINFVDLAGHERYLKTTAFGLTGLAPDHAMLVVAANNGVIGMTREHMGIALALKIPVFVVVTKVDMAPPNIYERTMKQIQKMLKAPGSRKLPVVIRTDEDVLVAARNFDDGVGRVAPIFPVSSVTGENMDHLRTFLNLLPPKKVHAARAKDRPEFRIDDSFSVPVGTVASGTCTGGVFAAGSSDPLVIGPDGNGNWEAVAIKSIHCHRMPVGTVRAGQSASFALKSKTIKRSWLRKGMVIVSPVDAVCAYRFQAEILVLHHATSITVGYEAMIHVGAVRQSARIISIDNPAASADSASASAGEAEAGNGNGDVSSGSSPIALPDGEFDGPAGLRKGPRRGKDEPAETRMLRAGDKALVTFAFLFRPEYIHSSERLIFREGRSRGIGRIIEVLPYVPKIKGTHTGTSTSTSSKK